jgi:transposase InsO family protein
MHSSWYGGHSGILKTTERLLLYYYWPNIHNDVKTYLARCEHCQKRQINPKIPTAQLQPLPLLSKPNQRVHADLFGPLKTSGRGKKFILVMTDAFTRYVELVAIENKETETVAQAIFLHWICRYGVPLEIVTDQGKEFVSHICQNLWEKLQLVHNTTTPRHPQANAQAEVVNRTIIRYLSSFVDDSTLDWESFLAPLMFSYNTTFHRSIKTSPFFMTFGLHPHLPEEITSPQYSSDLPTELMQRLQVARNVARQFMDNAALEYKQQHDLKAKRREFVVNQQVLLDEHSFLNKNQKLCPKFSGPHLITKVKGAVNVELLLDNGRRVVVHVNRIKPFLTHGGDVPSQNGEGVTDASVDGEQDDEAPMGHESQPTRRLTRSATKEQGLVFDKDNSEFSHPKTVQAIGSKKKKQTNPKPKTKSEQVISHYISRELESEEEEWNVAPEWDQQVEKKEVKQEVESSEEEEFYDIPESDTDRIEPDNPIPKEEPETKSVRFLPYVQQRKYYTDPELQTYADEKDELLRAAKAAVQKVQEEIEDAGEQGPFTSKASSPEGRGRLPRHSTDIDQQQRQRELDAGSIGQQRGRSTSVSGGGRSPSGAQRTTHGRDLPQVSDTSGVCNQSRTLSGSDRSGTALRQGGGSQRGVTRQDPGVGTKRRTDTTTTTTGASSKTVHSGSRRDGTEGNPRGTRGHGDGTQSGTKRSQLQTGSLGKGHPAELGKGHGPSTGSHGSATISNRGMVTSSGSDATGNLPTGRSMGPGIGKSSGMGSARLPLSATANRGTNASTDGGIDQTSNPTSAPESTTTTEESGAKPDSRRPAREPMEESSEPRPGTGTLPTDSTIHEGRRDSTRRRSSSTDDPAGESTRPFTRSQADTHPDEFGLSPFHPGPEGTNPSFYVTMLAETWCRNRQHLRDRIINGENIEWQTISEHKRRFEFIKREGERTKASLPIRFAFD